MYIGAAGTRAVTKPGQYSRFSAILSSSRLDNARKNGGDAVVIGKSMDIQSLVEHAPLEVPVPVSGVGIVAGIGITGRRARMER